MFTGSVNHDYTLQAGSPCIDAGDPDPAYNDPDGTRNDIGAIAYTGTTYDCGDADGSGGVNLLDVTRLINYLYKGGEPPDPMEAGDANGSGALNLLDVTYLINYLYKGGPGPVCP